jgi:hypothetical protein
MRGINKQRGEEGLAAIIVATVIMVVLSLITLGFARLMQREQRQSLDRSLSTQAFYAAESAINKAVSLIQDETNPYVNDKDNCNADASFNGSVDASVGAEYTCVLIDQAPKTLEYTQGSISTSASKVVPIRSENNAPIAQIRLAWEDPNLFSTTVGSSTTPVFGCVAPSLPVYTAWNARTPGMIRLDLIPTTTLDRTSIINNTISLFLYPSSAGCSGPGQTTINYSAHMAANAKGQIVRVNCAAGNLPRDCELYINIDTAVKPTQYYMRVKSIYHSSDMTVRLYDSTGASASQLGIKGAQVQVDATGKVNDVLRRVQVRVPVSKSYPVPDYVIQTTDSICKQIQVAPAPANIVDNSACPL